MTICVQRVFRIRQRLELDSSWIAKANENIKEDNEETSTTEQIIRMNSKGVVVWWRSRTAFFFFLITHYKWNSFVAMLFQWMCANSSQFCTQITDAEKIGWNNSLWQLAFFKNLKCLASDKSEFQMAVFDGIRRRILCSVRNSNNGPIRHCAWDSNSKGWSNARLWNCFAFHIEWHPFCHKLDTRNVLNRSPQSTPHTSRNWTLRHLWNETIGLLLRWIELVFYVSQRKYADYDSHVSQLIELF